MKIGLISDTHGSIDNDAVENLKLCDEIWHAGDIGTVELLDYLESLKPVRAVFGNIDGHKLRIRVPEHQKFNIKGLDVWMTHIGGYPGRYDRKVRDAIRQNPPGLFISGHSHILKIMPDDKLNLLHINPGAVGRNGLHKFRTMVVFEINDGKIKNLNAVELGRRGS